MTIETFVTLRDVRGVASTPEEFRTRLAQYDRRQLLWLCSAISFSLNFMFQTQLEDIHDRWVRRLFPRPEAERLVANKAIVFHRHQLLFLMQEAARYCPEIGGFPGLEIPLRQAGELFLMANDQLDKQVVVWPDPNPSSLQLIQMMTPSNEANLFTSAILKWGRSHKIVSQIGELRRGRSDFFDIRALFQQATGLEYRVFEALMTAVFTRVLNVSEVIEDATKFGLYDGYFSQLPIPAEAIEKFFAITSMTPEGFKTALNTQNPRANDFRVIRDRPLLRIGDRYLPLDAHNCFEKFDSAVYWSILSNLPEEDKGPFAGFWGAVFEDYVIWLFRRQLTRR